VTGPLDTTCAKSFALPLLVPLRFLCSFREHPVGRSNSLRESLGPPRPAALFAGACVSINASEWRRRMPEPLSSSPDFRFLGLVVQALEDQVVLYVGAGVSVTAGLPSWKELARLVHAKVDSYGVDLTGIDAEDLLAIADAAEAANGGDPTVIQEIALSVARFDEVDPTSTHRALVLLLLEGAASVMSTNWDTCIERSTPNGEALAVIVTNEDRMTTRTTGLLKVHGCARRPATALVTTNQLADTPVWASSEMAAKLSHATVVFVGIGDIAPYVAVRLNQLLIQLGSVDNVSVVSRSIVSGWSNSDWSTVLPGLAEARKIASNADEFLDSFLRAWVRHGVDSMRVLAADMEDTDLVEALEALVAVLLADTAPNVVEWLRRSCGSISAGTSAVHAHASHLGLLALAKWTSPAAILAVPHAGPAVSAKGQVDLHVQPGLAGPRVARAARGRVAQYRARGYLRPDEPVTVVCAGQIGRLEPAAPDALEQDVVASETPGDIISGPSLGPVVLVAANTILEGV
jgi:hypothetical protein